MTLTKEREKELQAFVEQLSDEEIRFLRYSLELSCVRIDVKTMLKQGALAGINEPDLSEQEIDEIVTEYKWQKEASGDFSYWEHLFTLISLILKRRNEVDYL